MSGIFGYFERNGKAACTETIRAMSDVIAHRGEVPEGYWINGQVALGHRLFKGTNELDNEKLLSVADGNPYIITADCRLDNRQQLFKQFAIPTSHQAQYCDNQLILKAYRYWGKQCPEYLLGDFAFAIWDKKERHLFCAVDQLGQKPFYFFQSPDLFAFASEIKALIQHPNIEKSLDENGFSIYLLAPFGAHKTLGDSTCFNNIKHLPAACSLVVSEKTVIKDNYWCLQKPSIVTYGDRDEGIAQFREIFIEAVQCRMRSSYPVGTFLSGGLDSSSISCVAAQAYAHQNKRLNAFASVLPPDYQGIDKDERIFIEAVSCKYSMDIRYITPKTRLLENYKKFIPFMEAPNLANPHVYSALLEAAQQAGVRTILDGCLGELGATYSAKSYLAQLAQQGAWIKLLREASLIAKQHTITTHQLLRTQVLPYCLPAIIYRQHRYRNALSAIDRMAIAKGFCQRANLSQHLKNGLQFFRRITDHQTDRHLKINFGRVPREGLGPAHNIRILYPYFDKRVLEFCLALPDDFFVYDGWHRYLIRASMEGILPKEVQWRTSKCAFSPDYYQRLEAAQYEFLEYIHSIAKDSLVRHYFDLNRLESTIKLMIKQGSWRPKKGRDTGRLVDFSVMSIVFLQWFESL